jgi:anti-anti-sigma factor
MQQVPDTPAFRAMRTDDPPGLAIQGDLGAEHAARFARALRGAAADVAGNVYLDCDGLDTVSVEGLRAMMDAAAELARAGRNLTVRRLSPYFLRIFRLAGWDQTPGLVLDLEALAAAELGNSDLARARRPRLRRGERPDAPDGRRGAVA